jgi:hypothetical protein
MSGVQQNVRSRNPYKRMAVKMRTPVANSVLAGTSAYPASAADQSTAQDVFTAHESQFVSLRAKSDKTKQQRCHHRTQRLPFNTVFQRTLAFLPALRRDACFLGPVCPSLNHSRRYYSPGVKPAASNAITDRIRHINLLGKEMRADEPFCIQKQTAKNT